MNPLTLSAEDFELAQMCEATLEEQEGPYYVCASDYRSSIAEGREGTPMVLGLRVLDSSCASLAGAVVDVWHCDAGGYYSGFDADPDELAGTSPVSETSTRFCRGAQVSGDDGIVEFTTIFPGWYAGRTTHVHVRVYRPDGSAFTSQIYFPESVRDQQYALSPYDEPRSASYPTNADEGIAESKLMRIEERDAGLVATISLIV